MWKEREREGKMGGVGMGGTELTPLMKSRIYHWVVVGTGFNCLDVNDVYLIVTDIMICIILL